MPGSAGLAGLIISGCQSGAIPPSGDGSRHEPLQAQTAYMARRRTSLTPEQLAGIAAAIAVPVGERPAVDAPVFFVGDHHPDHRHGCRTCVHFERETRRGAVVCALGRREGRPGDCPAWVREAGADAQHEVTAPLAYVVVQNFLVGPPWPPGGPLLP
jgi:hypothetical protein